MTARIAIWMCSVLLLSTASTAATVTLGLISKQTEVGSLFGQWELWAWTSSSDNDGISSSAVQLDGQRLTAFVQAPWVGSDTTIFGFGSSSFQGDLLIVDQLSVVKPPGVYYGVGSPDVPQRIPPPPDFPPIFSSRQVDWWMHSSLTSSPMRPSHPLAGDNPFIVPAKSVLLADGTTSNYLNLAFGDELDVNVWFLGQAAMVGGAEQPANVVLLLDHVPAIPEPATVSLVVAVFTFVLMPRLMRSAGVTRLDSVVRGRV